jgi:cation-transporting ATPase E
LKEKEAEIPFENLKKPNPSVGLSAEEVELRHTLGADNRGAEVRAKSYFAILKENLLTPFNALNAVLGVLVIGTGHIQNALFLVVAFVNLLLGTLQQIRAKVAVEKLTVLSKAKARVLRNGEIVELPPEEIVLHDVIMLGAGNQIPTDGMILSGNCEVDESFLTGEADPVYKSAGDTLLSGSLLTSGNIVMSVEKVGSDSYATRLTNASRTEKKINSEILRSFNALIKYLSMFILLVGAILFSKQFFLAKEPLAYSIASTTAAVIGMIPEGLILLTNIVLAVSVIRLSRDNILIQEQYCIETLARVDVLCIDKTGTITEGKQHVTEVISFMEADVEGILHEVITATKDSNSTGIAIGEYAKKELGWQLEEAISFSSARKWSGATFAEKGSYVIGAPDMLLPYLAEEKREEINKAYQAAQGRVLLLMQSDTPLRRNEAGNAVLEGMYRPVALIVLEDKIREEAPEIFSFLQEQDVAIKVISGDKAKTVADTAKRAGIRVQDYIDVHTLSDEALYEAARHYDVFGRVSPEQKKIIVASLQDAEHVVAMTGDGINDVLALKQADCSIAVASGSDAARTISQVVLLESNLYSIYHVIMEGRRDINNIKKSASLYLVKTIYSCILAVAFVFLPMAYPFQPIQLSLVSSLCVGIPSFFLALQPNKNIVEGHFMGDILKKAFPGALCIVIYVLLLSAYGEILGYTQSEVSTLCTIALGISAFVVLAKVSIPFTWLKGILFGLLVAAFFAIVASAGALLFFAPIRLSMWIMIAFVTITGIPLNAFFTSIINKMGNRFDF